MSGFNCTSCGACCRNIGKFISDAATRGVSGGRVPIDIEVVEFPFEPLSDGSCPKLGGDGHCTVYATRPDICNVETTYEKHFKDRMNKEDYYGMNHKACEVLAERINNSIKIEKS